MNPFFNPKMALPVLFKYFTVPNRYKRLNKKQMQKFRDKQIKKIIKYAFSVPLYNKKYKEAGLTPNDISGINDIKNLPFISKKDFVNNFPDGLIPKNYDKSKSYVVTTGGSSGNPLSIYTDFQTMSESIYMALRQGNIYGYNIRKSRFADIGTHLEGRFDKTFGDVITSNTKILKNPNTLININAFEPIKEIIQKLNTFKPDIIYTYPITLQHIAYFKKKGYADNINPRFLQVSGYSIDDYTKNYIEDAFGTKVVNLYQSVESAGTIAYECYDGSWHINDDWYHVETINEKNEPLKDGKRGHIVITRLFGKGVPIIRYTGMDDWVTLVKYYECSCGICGPILKNGVEGRVSNRIILKDGRVFPAQSFELVSLVLKKLGTRKVKQFQIVQHSLEEIEILINIDEEQRNIGPSVKLIINKIKEIYEEKCGLKKEIIIREVDKIKSPKNKPEPIVISKVNFEEGLKVLEE